VGNNLMQADLSVWGMYHHADIVVKVVMIGLILASVVTWAIFFGKGAEILASKRRLKREQQQLAEARSLDQASDIAILPREKPDHPAYQRSAERAGTLRG
jgi:biopolymer transport protein ExbB